LPNQQKQEKQQLKATIVLGPDLGDLFDHLNGLPTYVRAKKLRNLAYLGYMVEQGKVSLPGGSTPSPVEQVEEEKPKRKVLKSSIVDSFNQSKDSGD